MSLRITRRRSEKKRAQNCSSEVFVALGYDVSAYGLPSVCVEWQD